MKWPWPYEKLDPATTAEIAYKEWYRLYCGGAAPVRIWERQIQEPLDFLEMPTARWHHQENSPPINFRTLPLISVSTCQPRSQP